LLQCFLYYGDRESRTSATFSAALAHRCAGVAIRSDSHEFTSVSSEMPCCRAQRVRRSESLCSSDTVLGKCLLSRILEPAARTADGKSPASCESQKSDACSGVLNRAGMFLVLLPFILSPFFVSHVPCADYERGLVSLADEKHAQISSRRCLAQCQVNILALNKPALNHIQPAPR